MKKLEAALSISVLHFNQPACVHDSSAVRQAQTFPGFVTLSALRHNFCRAMAAGFGVAGVAYALL